MSRCGWCSDGYHDDCPGDRTITRRDGQGEYTIELSCECDHE